MTKIFQAVVGIVYSGDDFLILKKKGRWVGWQFAQGKLDEKESKEEALVREIQEETGLKEIKIVKKLPFRADYRFKENKEEVHKFLTFYLVNVSKGDIVLSHEHSDFKWCSYKEALESIKFNKEIFRKAYRILKDDINNRAMH